MHISCLCPLDLLESERLIGKPLHYKGWGALNTDEGIPMQVSVSERDLSSLRPIMVWRLLTLCKGLSTIS